MTRTISQAALAAELGCHRSTIGRYIGRGMPQNADGTLDRHAALRWLVHNTSGHGGGWTEGTTRGRGISDRAEALLAAKPARHSPGPAPVSVADQIHDARVRLLAQLAAPSEVLQFARVCLRAGCTPIQAWVLANWYACQPCLAVPDVTPEDVSGFTEPTREQWTALLGSDFDFAASEQLEARATAPETSPEAA